MEEPTAVYGPSERWSITETKKENRKGHVGLRGDPGTIWSWAAVEGPVMQISTERHEKKYRNPENFRCGPLDQNTQRWTQDECDVKMAKMVSCQLQMYRILK